MNNSIQQSSPSKLPKWGPFVALGSTLRRYIQFKGRASRSEFWYTMLGHGIISLIILAVALPFTMNCIVETKVFRILFLLYQAALALPLLALSVRRMHDIGRSGASLFFYFIPLAGPVIILLFLLSASAGTNQYGEAPATIADSSAKKWGPFVALGSTIRRYIQFKGRASRSEFWYTMLGHGLMSLILLALIAIGIILCLFCEYNVTTVVLTSVVGLCFLLYQAFLAIPLLALSIRRMHDIGRSGASLCFYFIPLVGPIILLVFLLSASEGANQYGEAPATIADSSAKSWGPFVALGSTLKRYMQFSGRASRSEFWYTILGHGMISLILLVLIAVGTLLCIFDDCNGTNIVLTGIVALCFLLYQAFIAIPLLALAVRRMHDIGRSGASLFFYFIPLVGPIILLIFLLTPSAEANQYGKAPSTVTDSAPETWGPFVAIGSTLRRYLQFKGRASRSEFWYTMLGHGLISVIFLALIAIGIILCLFGTYNVTTCIVLTGIVALCFLLYQVFIILPILALAVRRMHDIGRSGASLFFFFIPLVGPIVLLIFLLSESAQANQYGEAPEPVAECSTGGNFVNGIISIFSRTHCSAIKATNTWCYGVLGCWLLLWMVTPGELPRDMMGYVYGYSYSYSDYKVAYQRGKVAYQRGEIEQNEEGAIIRNEPFPTEEWAEWATKNDMYFHIPSLRERLKKPRFGILWVNAMLRDIGDIIYGWELEDFELYGYE